MSAAILALFLLVGAGAQAQTSAAEPQGKHDYRQEPFVIESVLDRVVYENDGTGTRSTRARVRVQSDAGVRQYGLILFAYAGANETPEVEYVRVRKPDGSQVATPAEDVQDLPADVTQAAPFYSDLRVKHVAVKGLAPGDAVEYSFRARLHTPQVPGQFWVDLTFNRESIVLEQTIELSVPKERALKMSRSESKPAMREEGSRRIYTWKSSNLVREETKEATKNAARPIPPIRISSFQSWEELGRWYGGLQRERVAVTPAIQAKATELTRSAKSEAERRKAIYKYVASQFRYIGIAFGVGRYRPHTAEEVLANQYGDCKDKHTLLAALLKAAGLTAYPALASTSQEIDPEVPSPSQFDHLISALPQAGGYEWLDATIEVAPYGYLITPIRDKQVLVIPEDGPARLVKTPAELPFPRHEAFRSEGKLDAKGTLEADMDYTLRGDVELLLRLAFRNTPQHQWQDLVQKVSQVSGFGGTVSEVVVSPPEATEEPLRIGYHYTRKEYSDWANQRTSPPLPRTGLPLADEDAREEPVELGAPGELVYESRMTLPEGYSLRPPAPVDVREAFAEYHASYTFSGGVLEAKRRMVVKRTKVGVDELKAYREFQKDVSDHEFTFMALRSGTAPESAPVSAEAATEAERLLDEARDAARGQDYREAADLLEKALAADPKLPEAWMLLGMSRMTMGDVEGGLEAMRKEVKLHPKNTRALKTLASTLMSFGREEEAIPLWRGLMEADPEDQEAATNLGNILLSQGRYAEAARELEGAVELNPKNARLWADVAEAYLLAGDEAKGMAAVAKVKGLNPGHNSILNNVAYALAERGEKLNEALRYAEDAVREVEQESAQIELSHLEASDLGTMQSLGSFWDTLGWVHLQLGHAEVAERYLKAAWDLLQAPVVGDHLGRVYERMGRKADATRAYAQALAAGPTAGILPPGYAPVVGASADSGKDTHERLRRLTGSDMRAENAINRARSELSQARTVLVPRPAPQKGSAEYFVLLSPGPKFEGARFVRGAEELRAADRALASAPYGIVFPGRGPVKILRRGLLYCGPKGPTCEFVLFTADNVQSVD